MGASALKIEVRGLVQGVGFRPFVFRIATRCNLNGWVKNTNECVYIEVKGKDEDINSFLIALTNEKPPASIIESVKAVPSDSQFNDSFIILPSDNISEEITGVSPDIAVCSDCLADMKNQVNRIDYPLINCTNCGPRFSIIKDLPYDRPLTTMAAFTMCHNCSYEYHNPLNRRFHAQPVACNTCGPVYELYTGGKLVSGSVNSLIKITASLINEGKVVMIKGMGGMHLACDPFNEEAVARLREIKSREGKPFALMFRDYASASEFAFISEKESEALNSWQRPIVLLQRKEKNRMEGLVKDVCSGLNLIGVMLPYMPFHHLLFSELSRPALVLTSGNISSEPIVTGNSEALSVFSERVAAVVLHNREIWNRSDDSVVRVMGGIARVIRRSRGYVPAPLTTASDVDGIVAFGAELTNCFCVGRGKKAILSQHIGDLQNIETTVFYNEALSRFIKLFRIRPSLLAVDMHPDYISSRTALSFADLPLTYVQHHHAHIASCMSENCLDEKVLGIAFDGTGYGPDGNIWGSEFLICDLIDFRRVSHFGYIPLPGGDMATEEPWRIALSWLYKVYGKACLSLDIPVIRENDPESCRMLTLMIDKGINCPLTAGAGRLFDAVASLTGLLQKASYQAEAPMKLEALASHDI